MKKFLVLLVALFLSVTAFAQNIVSGNLTATNNVISTDPGQLVYLQLTDTSGSANTFIVYDSDTATTTNRVKPAFYKRTFYTTNEVVTYTNPLGRSESVTNVVRASVLALVAASTNEMKRVYTVTVPANSTVVFEPVDPVGYTFGYTIKALGTGSYNTTYLPMQ
jgi:hypothetical protein